MSAGALPRDLDGWPYRTDTLLGAVGQDRRVVLEVSERGSA
jgi:hypothetical protein